MAKLTIDWTGMRCPRCSYVRSAQEAAVGAECPSCQAPYVIPAAAGPRGAHDWLREFLDGLAAAWRDPSFYSLLAVNGLVLWYAIVHHLSVRGFILIFWLQGAVICACSVARILMLQRFSTSGISSATGSLKETASTKREMASLGAMFFGSFYGFYLLAILIPPGGAHGPLSSPAVYLLCTFVYALNHVYSLRRNVAQDAAGYPNIGTLMMLPWLRILPMHVIIFPGIFIEDSTGALIFFGIVKTIADCVMHVAEHRVLAGARS